jgi:hypothetical protein
MNINSISAIEGVLRLMKNEPNFLLDYLESTSRENMANFMNELSCFYFDYSEIPAYNSFLKVFFSKKYERKGIIEYDEGSVDIFVLTI